MIKVQVCNCIKPFNSCFEKDKLYILHPSKSEGVLTAYIHPTKGFAIVPRGFIRLSIPFYQMYFEPIAEMYVKNYDEVRKLKQKTMEEILFMLNVYTESGENY